MSKLIIYIYIFILYPNDIALKYDSLINDYKNINEKIIKIF